MELFKTNGQLKPRKALFPHYVEYRTQIAKKQFEDAKKLEHEGLYPEMIANPAYVVDGEEPEFIANPDFISYDVWMAEDVVTQVAQDAVYDTDGITVITPAVPEIRELVRPFVAPDVLESELDDYLASNAEYKAHLDSEKDKQLSRVTVTTTSGKEFYADPLSRVDIADAVQVAINSGLTSTSWKLVSGWTTVTLDEMKEAQRLGLEAKGAIIG